MHRPTSPPSAARRSKRSWGRDGRRQAQGEARQGHQFVPRRSPADGARPRVEADQPDGRGRGHPGHPRHDRQGELPREGGRQVSEGKGAMRLNTIKPAAGSNRARRRVGRGIGSGRGKTAGRGHKGQKARSGGFHKVGFEGGQMPLQRRLPKRGFVSRSRNDTAEVRLSDLARLPVTEIDLAALKAAGVVPESAKAAKVIRTGKLDKAVKLSGIAATAGAKAAIEAAGGSLA